MVTSKKGRLFSPDDTLTAVIDNTPVEFGGNKYCNSVRTIDVKFYTSLPSVQCVSIGLH